MFGFGKGKMEIRLSKFNFAPGETIDGTVFMQLKKPIFGKVLTIRLYGEKKTTSYGSNSRTNYQRVFDFSQPLDGEKDYLAAPLEYQFRITIPQNVGQAQVGGGLGTAIKAVQMLSGTSSRISWYLEARLDVKGLDVSKRIQINVA